MVIVDVTEGNASDKSHFHLERSSEPPIAEMTVYNGLHSFQFLPTLLKTLIRRENNAFQEHNPLELGVDADQMMSPRPRLTDSGPSRFGTSKIHGPDDKVLNDNHDFS